MKQDKYQILARYLPKKLIYFSAIQLVAEATSGKYGNTVVPEIGAMDAIGRYARIHAIPGSGKDAFYDSNRNRK